MAVQRVKRLKDMVDMLDRLPASPDRDRMLSEVRSRLVDVDTGVAPRAMLPVREREPTPAVPRPPRRDGAITRTAAAVEPARAVPAAAAPADRELLAWTSERLSLEEAHLPHVQALDGRAIPPWTLGLRG
jgi:hypothetical protein